jgi:hypothetical protein
MSSERLTDRGLAATSPRWRPSGRSAPRALDPPRSPMPFPAPVRPGGEGCRAGRWPGGGLQDASAAGPERERRGYRLESCLNELGRRPRRMSAPLPPAPAEGPPPRREGERDPDRRGQLPGRTPPVSHARRARVRGREPATEVRQRMPRAKQHKPDHRSYATTDSTPRCRPFAFQHRARRPGPSGLSRRSPWTASRSARRSAARRGRPSSRTPAWPASRRAGSGARHTSPARRGSP